MGQIAVDLLACSIFTVSFYRHAIIVVTAVTGAVFTAMPVAMPMTVLPLHLVCLILINISIPIGIHLIEHCFSMARMFIPADSPIIVGIRHGHSTASFAILLITLLVTIAVLLVTIAVLLVAILVLVIMRLGHHVAFFQGLCSERILACRGDRCSSESRGDGGSYRERNNRFFTGHIHDVFS